MMNEGQNAHELERRPKRGGWLLLIGGVVLVLAICSGSATAIGGINLGQYVAVTIAILFAAFVASCGVAGVLLYGRRKR